MLWEPERTRYDLSFRLFRFPVRVHPWFWVLSLLLYGDDGLRAHGLLGLVIWVVVVFVSIIVHELGHALAFRWFGTDSHIVLHAFGGLAIPWSRVDGRWRRIIISLAGPAAGFILLAVVYYSNHFFRWAGPNEPLLLLYVYLYVVNLYWGIFNLLPIFPLDGGQVCKEVCGAIWPRNGERIALEISIVAAGLGAFYCLATAFGDRNGWLDFLPWWFPHGSIWTAVLFALLAVYSYQALQQVHWTESHWDDSDDRPPWRR
ncbi:MAG TPA: site-2 protease family protein [Gemmataceae bacterium]|nr:site-2 protease family protein [Gemmataceae bacterium]